MMREHNAFGGLTLVLIILISGCATPERTAPGKPLDTGTMQYLFDGVFPIYPGAVVVSADKCPSGSQLCAAKLETEASKSDVLNFYKIIGKQKGWIFDKETRAKTETSSLANPKIWGLANFTGKTGRFKSLLVLIPSDAHTGATKTSINVTLMNPPGAVTAEAPFIPAREKIDIGKSGQSSDWKIDVAYVKYEGTRAEVKDTGMMRPAVIGNAPAGFQLVRVRAHIERLDGKPINDSFLKQPVTVQAGGQSYKPVGGRTKYGEFYSYATGARGLLVPVTEKSEVDYVFSIPTGVVASAFAWPNMPPILLAAENAPPPVSSPEAQKAAASAAEFLKNDKYDDAIREATRALEIDPNNVLALETRAESHRMMKKYDEAIKDADRLLAIQPDHAYTLRTRASSLWSENRFDEAIRDATLSLKIEPGNVFALKYRADAHRMKDNFSLAIQDASKALEVQPNNAFVIRTRAESYRCNGNFDEAIADANRALEIQSDDAFALRTRAAAFWAKDNHDEAIRDASEALKIEPNNFFALKYRADAYRMKNEYGNAISDADNALAIMPNDAFVLRTRAESHRMNGDCAKAIADANRSLEIEPDNAFAQKTLAECANSNTPRPATE